MIAGELQETEVQSLRGESYLATGRNKRTCLKGSHDYSGRRKSLKRGASYEGISIQVLLPSAMTIHSIVFNYSYAMPYVYSGTRNSNAQV